jgi:hypothetical protein
MASTSCGWRARGRRGPSRSRASAGAPARTCGPRERPERLRQALETLRSHYEIRVTGSTS